MTVQFAVAFIATLAFSILFQVPKRHYVMCGLGGACAWAVFLLARAHGLGAPVAYFLASLALSMVTRVASVWFRAPVIIFLVAGIFPLVPGTGIYFTAYHLFAGEGATAAARGLDTLIAAGAISLGILFGFSLPQSLFDKVVALFSRKK